MNPSPRPQSHRVPLPAHPDARTVRLSALVLLGALVFQYGPPVLGLGDNGVAFWANAWWTVTPGIAAGLSFSAAGRLEGEDRAAWRQIGLGCAAWGVGTLIWALSAMTFPGPADIAYLGTCLFMIRGMFLFCRVRTLTWIQLGNFVLALSAVAIALLLLLLPFLQASVLGLHGTAVAFAYPVFWFGTTAFGIMCLVSDTPADKRPILSLLIAGSLAQALANLFYGLLLMGSPYRIGAVFDSGWVVTFLLFAWAAYDCRMGAAPEAPRRAQAGRSTAPSTVDAFVPAAALALILAAVAVFGIMKAGAVFAFFIPPALLFVVFLGLRGRWMLLMERSLLQEAQRSRDELSFVLENTIDQAIVFDAEQRLELPAWLSEAIAQGGDVLAISPRYFDLTSGLDRFLYRLAHRHVGKQNECSFTFQDLHGRSGWAQSYDDFARDLRKAIAQDTLPDYRLTERDGPNGPVLDIAQRSLAVP